MTKHVPTHQMNFDSHVTNVPGEHFSSSAHDDTKLPLGFTLIGIAIFCAVAWCGVAWLVMSLLR